MNTSIFAVNKSFDIKCRVVKWDEPSGLNFLPTGKYTKRNVKFEDLSKVLSQFTIHWSATYKASHMFNGLKMRGLSCNFMIDDDCDQNGYATIYQNLPIEYAGWSQGGPFNGYGPGVELSYQPAAWQENWYDANDQAKWKVPPHDTVEATINGTKLKVHLPTQAQMNSLYQLIWGYCELFPHIKPVFPRDGGGKLIYKKYNGANNHVGLLNHYHITSEKIDAAGLDMEKIEKEVSDRLKMGY
jgi:hypothetical protein